MPRWNAGEGLRVVLVNTRNPLNIGAAARAMSNFGFEHLRVVSPYELAFREARSAVGAAPLLAKAEEFRSVAEAAADCSLVVGTTALSRRNPEQRVLDLAEGAALIRRRMAVGSVALLFGSEKRGLANEDLSHCHWLLRIPTQEAHCSMNLGQAVAVCLYEVARDARPVLKPEKTVSATSASLERVTSVLLDVLHASGYLKTPSGKIGKRRPAAPADEKMRRLVRRLNLSEADAELFLGMLRQILWKLDPTGETDLRK
ncbi:MAG TPA: TrmH family RNA methyltransferase [Candidatus Angelobacter sp.]|nr:TrmH family RNA methyltransferase [Candidatus Angelobacter sp.]